MSDTFFLVAPWNLLFLLLLVGGLAGAAGNLLLQRRVGWNRRKRVLVSAALVPALLMVLSLVGWLASSNGSDGWQDLVEILWLTIALGGGAIAFVGGLAGAVLAERRRRA